MIAEYVIILPLYFSRVFAASEGCSPSVYRTGQEHT